MLDHVGLVSAAEDSGGGWFDGDAGISARRGIHRDSLEDADEHNRLGDSDYYDGRWHEAEYHFEQAYEIVKRATAGDRVEPRAWEVRSRVARNRGMLDWLRGRSSWKFFLNDARSAADRVEAPADRWYLLVDIALFEAQRLRAAGEFPAARKVLADLSALSEDDETQTYLRLRSALEDANLLRTEGFFGQAESALLVLGHELRAESPQPTAWPTETLELYRNWASDFRLVNAVDAVLFHGLAGRVDSECAVSAWRRVHLYAALRTGASKLRGYRLFDLRSRKTQGWIRWISGRRSAVPMARDVVIEAQSLGDWRTQTLGTCLLSAALLAERSAERAVEHAEQAYQLAHDQRYWKGMLLASVLGVRGTRASDRVDGVALWRSRLDELAERAGTHLPAVKLALAACASDVQLPLGQEIVGSELATLRMELARDGVAPVDACDDPRVAPLLVHGAELIPVIAKLLREGDCYWACLLPGLVGREGPSDATLSGWEDWARAAALLSGESGSPD
ncbi:MAG: hypothetical protein H6742_13670 [Alphaproteobacteria bacterium]|nr:hypothetical protein [Alphaproteobacteria bacterium]